MKHETAFQRRSRSAPARHFSGGYVEHGPILPMEEKMFRWVRELVK